MLEEDSTRTKKRLILPLGAGLVAFAAALTITSGHGPGLDPDSMAYVGAATSLAHGRGLRVPLGKWQQADSTVTLTTWPPAFSAAMAIPQSVGLAPEASARLVLAVSAGGTIALTALALAELPSLVIAAALAVILVTPSFVTVHLSILSEPLFLASLALTLCGLVRGRAGTAGAGATLGVMTRYAGACAAIAAAAWFFFFEKGDLQRRISRAAISSAPAAFAFTLWGIHNSRVKVVQSAIAVGYHPGIASTLRGGLTTILSWIAPGAPEGIAAWIAIIAVIALIVALMSRSRSARVGPFDNGATRIAAAAGSLLACYLAVLIGSRLFVGGAIVFDGRILSPAIFLLEVFLIPVCATALARKPAALRLIASAAVAVWIAAAIYSTAPIVLDSIQDGNDFAASDWRESPTVEWIEHEGRGSPIYTNWPAAVFFDAHRNAYDIPSIPDPDSLTAFGRKLAERHGVFAAFNERNFDYPAIDSIAAGAGLVKLRTLPDGAIWAPRPGGNGRVPSGE